MPVTLFSNVVQSLCLPGNSYYPEELYYRGEGKTPGDRAAGEPLCLRIPDGKTIRTDTLFNTFAVWKWRQYTRMKDLRIELVLKGCVKAEVRGCGRVLQEGTASGPESVLSSKTLAAEQETVLELLTCGDVSSLPDFLYLTLTAGKGGAEIRDVRYAVSAQRDENLDLACCFCTYRREAELEANVERLLAGIVHNPESVLHGRLEIYVADNGGTLAGELYDKEPMVHLFPNRNFGGSAGFTRCMIESCLRREGRPFSHIILMDDDAVVLPEAVERTGALAGLLRAEYREYMIGGAWMNRSKPALQVQSGTFFTPSEWRHEVRGQQADLTERAGFLTCESRPDSEINVNGWWYTCIPASLVREDNLPLPFFFQMDDTEYGIRCGGRFLRMNGICVWHPHAGTDENARAYVLGYYCRNTLILEAAHCPDPGRMRVWVRFLRLCVRQLRRHQTMGAKYICLGHEEFYRGPEAFLGVNPEERHAQILRLRDDEPDGHSACAAACAADMLRVSRMILLHHPRIYRAWKAAIPELQRIEFWEKYLGI